MNLLTRWQLSAMVLSGERVESVQLPMHRFVNAFETRSTAAAELAIVFAMRAGAPRRTETGIYTGRA